MAERDWKADLELCEKATPGPWDYHRVNGCKEIGPRRNRQDIREVACTPGIEEQEDRANAAFIAAAREALPYWIRKYLIADGAYESMKSHLERAEANNAALVQRLLKCIVAMKAHAVISATAWHLAIDEAERDASSPHPGAALLEELERKDGLLKRAVEKLVEGCQNECPSWDQAPEGCSGCQKFALITEMDKEAKGGQALHGGKEDGE